MDLKQELQIIKQMNRRISINQLKDSWRNPFLRIMIIVMLITLIILPIFMFLTAPSNNTEAVSDSEEEAESVFGQKVI